MEALGLFLAGGTLVAASPETGGALVMAGAVICLFLGAKPTSDE